MQIGGIELNMAKKHKKLNDFIIDHIFKQECEFRTLGNIIENKLFNLTLRKN